jgi:hypothetical protein
MSSDSDNQSDHPILTKSSTELTMRFSSQEYARIYRDNRPSKFKQPIIEPFIPTAKTMVGLKFITLSPGYYNVLENDVIDVYTTIDGIESEYVDSILIEAGYYPTSESFVDVINVRLRTLCLKGKLPVVPRFTFNRENGFDEDGSMSLYPVSYMNNNAKVWVCLELPKKIFKKFGFTEDNCNHKNQFEHDEIKSTWGIEMKFPFPIELRLNILPENIRPLYFISKYVNTPNTIGFDKLAPEYIGKRLREIEFTIWDGNDKVERRSDLGATSVILVFKEEVE